MRPRWCPIGLPRPRSQSNCCEQVSRPSAGATGTSARACGGRLDCWDDGLVPISAGVDRAGENRSNLAGRLASAFIGREHCFDVRATSSAGPLSRDGLDRSNSRPTEHADDRDDDGVVDECEAGFPPLVMNAFSSLLSGYHKNWKLCPNLISR